MPTPNIMGIQMPSTAIHTSLQTHNSRPRATKPSGELRSHLPRALHQKQHITASLRPRRAMPQTKREARSA